MRWTMLLAGANLRVMDHRSFSNPVLHRIDAACNMAQFYAMSIEPSCSAGVDRFVVGTCLTTVDR
jgi:hypothetical protein